MRSPLRKTVVQPNVGVFLSTLLLILLFHVYTVADVLLASDFKDQSSLKVFNPLVPLKTKDTFKITKGHLLIAAGKNSSVDLIAGDTSWSDYALIIQYKLALPRANSGLDICVRNTQFQPQDQPGGISIHFKRHQKTGKPIRWIRQYGNRDRDIMPDQNAPVFDDGKWHAIKVSVYGRDLMVEMDGAEFYSMEDVLDIEHGNVMISVSDGARLTIRQFRVDRLP